MAKVKKLITLFIITFSVSMTANSGYAIISVLKNRLVHKYHWFNDDEMLECITLAQSAPGALGVNISVISGYRISGLAGSFSAVLGCSLPPLIMMLLVTYFYETLVSNVYVALFMKGMQIGVCAMLLDITFDLIYKLSESKQYYKYVLVILCFILIQFFHVSVLPLASICVVLGIIKAYLLSKKIKEVNHD